MDLIDYELQHDPSRLADRVTRAVLKEIRGRRGFKWDELPEDIRKEFYDTCIAVGRKALRNKSHNQNKNEGELK